MGNENSTLCDESSDNGAMTLAANFIKDDLTWRPLLGYPDLCVWKKFSGFAVGHFLAIQECDVGKRKNSWAYDATSWLISHFSDREEWLNFCVQAKEGSGTRVRIADCDTSDEMQVWDYADGQIRLRAQPDVCMQSSTLHDDFSNDDDNYLKTTNKCTSTVFG